MGTSTPKFRFDMFLSVLVINVSARGMVIKSVFVRFGKGNGYEFWWDIPSTPQQTFQWIPLDGGWIWTHFWLSHSSSLLATMLFPASKLEVVAAKKDLAKAEAAEKTAHIEANSPVRATGCQNPCECQRCCVLFGNPLVVPCGKFQDIPVLSCDGVILVSLRRKTGQLVWSLTWILSIFVREVSFVQCQWLLVESPEYGSASHILILHRTFPLAFWTDSNAAVTGMAASYTLRLRADLALSSGSAHGEAKEIVVQSLSPASEDCAVCIEQDLCGS